MADHVIIQARDQLITLLKAGVAAVSGRVYRPDEAPKPGEVDETRTPYLMVQVGDDSDEPLGINGGAGEPQLLESINQAFFVHAVVKQDGDAERAAYNLRRDVESTLLATANALTLGGRIQMLTRLAGANNRDDAIDQGAYAAVVQLQARIFHLQGSPDSFTY
jgi:hypothetical protein